MRSSSLRRRLSQRIIANVIARFVWLLDKTIRYEYQGQEHLQKARDACPYGVWAYALYHENLFAGIMCHTNRRLAPLASLSRDGDIVTSVMDQLGYRTIRGSSSRGGEQARDQLVEVIEDGYFPTITVDGPRGPRRIVKGGIIDIARRSGIGIVTMTPVASRYWVFKKSWDHFRLPKPFSKVIILYGEPLFFPAETKGKAFGDAKRKVKEQLENAEKTVASCFP